jgi:hypothetical protein
MPNWIEVFENHQIHNVVKNCLNLIDSILEDVIPQHHMEDIQRISTVLRRLKLYLDNFEPFFNNQQNGRLDQVANYLNDVNNQMNAYKSNKQVDHINNTHSYLNNIIESFPHFHSRNFPNLRGVRENSIQYQRETEKYLQKTHNKYEEIVAKFNESTGAYDQLSSTAQQSIDQLESFLQNLQESFDDAEAKRLERFEASEKERTDNFILEKNEKTKQFNDKLREYNEGYTSLTLEIKKYNDGLRDELRTDVEIFVDELKDLKKEAQSLVNGIASDTMAKHYKEIADDEKKIKFWWNIGAVISIMGLFAFSVYTFKSIPQENVSWFSFLSKVITTATIGTLVAYCANQANKYHRSEQSNRKMQLELQAISPYLEGLNYEDKNAIKAKLAERFFGSSEPSSEPNQVALTPEAIKQITDLIKELNSK